MTMREAGTVYGLDALFGGQDFKQPPLGPGQIHTVTTAITIPLPGTFKAYAQVDTSYSDPNLYAWWGSNPEGYGIPPYPEERNVFGGQAIYGQRVYNLSAHYQKTIVSAGSSTRHRRSPYGWQRGAPCPP